MNDCKIDIAPSINLIQESAMTIITDLTLDADYTCVCVLVLILRRVNEGTFLAYPSNIIPTTLKQIMRKSDRSNKWIIISSRVKVKNRTDKGWIYSGKKRDGVKL